MASKTFNLISKKLIEEVGRCELCGSRRNLEVHHIIPRCTYIPGMNIDLDDEDNLIVVCGSCHSRLTPRRMLTKYGIAKMPISGDENGEYVESKLKMQQFYKIIKNLDYGITIEDWFDTVEYVFADYMSDEDKRERKERLGL